MSKIGRKPIDISAVEVSIVGQEVQVKGKKWSGVHTLPEGMQATITDKKLLVSPVGTGKADREARILWGLHRALLANKIMGADKPFERKLNINGLGFKATVSGKKMDLSLGFSHKIQIPLPDHVTIEMDKTGQALTLKSPDREALGALCAQIRSFRPPEPYKGTGVKFAEETIKRKAGKAKVASA